MPLFLGQKQVCLYLNNKRYALTLVTDTNELLPDNALISLDDYYLKDINNIYLICLDEDNESEQLLLTADEAIITALSGQRVMVRKGEE